MRPDGDAGLGRIFQGAVEAVVAGVGHIREAQLPIAVLLHRFHESIGNAHRNIEVGDRVFVRLAGDELLDIRVIHAQHGHIGPTPRTPLGDLAKGLIIHAQEAHRPGGLPGRGLDQGVLGAQARERKAIASARLLDQGGVAQALEDARMVAAHIV